VSALCRLAAWWLVAAAAAAQAPLEVGERTKGILKADDTPLTGHGPSQTFEIAVRMQGTFTVTLESYDFDAFVKVESTDGKLAREDDNGLLETNARAVFVANEKLKYRVVVASAREKVGGEFFVTILPGELEPTKPEKLLEEALQFRSTAAERALARQDKRAAARHRYREGSLHASATRWAKARTQFELALGLAREVVDRHRESLCLSAVGASYWYEGNKAKAREAYLQWHALAKQVGDKAAQADAMRWVGASSYELGDYKKALEQLSVAVALAAETKDLALEGELHARIGFAHLRSGEAPLARKALDAAAAVAKRVREAQVEQGEDPQDRMWRALPIEELVAEGMGELHFSAKEFASARKEFQRQLTLARQLQDTGREAVARAHVRACDDAMEKSGEISTEASEAPASAPKRAKIVREPARPARTADAEAAKKAVERQSTIGDATVALAGDRLELQVKIKIGRANDSSTHAELARMSLLLLETFLWLEEFDVRVHDAKGALVSNSTVKLEKAMPYLEQLHDPFAARRMADWWNQIRD